MSQKVNSLVDKSFTETKQNTIYPLIKHEIDESDIRPYCSCKFNTISLINYHDAVYL